MGRVLIVGASGVVGSAAVERFLAEDDREVVAVSRRRPEVDVSRPYEHIAVDLRDATATRAAFGALDDVEDVVYAALFEKPGVMEGWTERDQMDTNLAMLRNVLDAVLAATPGLRHVGVLQGTKAYGVHLHPIPIPARERFPRDPHENFYWLQQDHLAEQAAQHGFSWTILRPQLVVGSTLNAPMNMIPVIGVYGAICREEGLPFGFPGGAQWVWQTSDARIVAGALLWASRAEPARDEIFNITNGEVCEWHHLWPAIADALGLEPGPDTPRRLSTWLPEHADTWDRVVEAHGLRPLSLAEVVGDSHHYSDFIFVHGAQEAPPPALVSDVKIRAAGFTEVIDTEESFRHWLGVLMRRGVLPPATTGRPATAASRL
jgi:nucleoside-diphosphate-sugar epimerase